MSYASIGEQIAELKLQRERELIEERGYSVIEGPWLDKSGARRYKLMTPCHHEWTVTWGNFRGGTKKALAEGKAMPCSICGSKNRTMKAVIAAAEANRKRRK
jgi:hypothetical protein